MVPPVVFGSPVLWMQRECLAVCMICLPFCLDLLAVIYIYIYEKGVDDELIPLLAHLYAFMCIPCCCDVLAVWFGSS